MPNVRFYLVSFVDAMIVMVQGSLNPYITSDFHKHGLLTSVGIVASILSGCCSLTLAKIIDVWGRVEGFLCMLLLVVISLIMKATCKNIETYLGAHVLYWTGHIGLMVSKLPLRFLHYPCGKSLLTRCF
jgi:MFS family permease